MSSFTTNGYIVRLLISAADDPHHPHHSDAANFLAMFRSMESKFFTEVHPNVDIGLAISETRSAGIGNPNIFTTHGPRHISDLIKSMDTLVEAIAKSQNGYTLSVLEAYILLCAAHIHDVANVDQRDRHPEHSNIILRKHKDLFVTATTQYIYDVARVHGGKDPSYGPDTIRSLGIDSSVDPHLPLLAGLIRLGDELSENQARVPDLVAENHPYAGMSRLAFAYAKSFVTFRLRGDTLFLVFNVYPQQKSIVITDDNGGQITFMDFLEKKIDVIEQEARYCSQYSRPILDIVAISITINYYAQEEPSQLAEKMSFNLHLNHGYPDKLKPLCQRSPQLEERKIKRLEECFADYSG